MPAKERSPNYPGLALDGAVQAIRRVYEAERRSVAPTSSVARALGHESMSGPALMKLAALRQYGLLEDVSQGKVRVSDDAMPIVLRKSDDPEYAEALKRVALAPPLLAELFKDYAQASDDTLRYHLITERGFSEEGATRVIKIFRANIAFAKLDASSYDRDKVKGLSTSAYPVGIHTLPDHLYEQLPDRPRRSTEVAYSWPLPDGNDVEVAFKERPTAKAVDRLIAYLDLMKGDLAETEQLQSIRDASSIVADLNRMREE
jgi:hypothetical protein